MAANSDAAGGSEPRRYEIRVRGPIGPAALQAFPTLTASGCGTDTLLTGSIPDQSALYGVINQLESLGLQLLEIHRRGEARSERQDNSHDRCDDDSSGRPA